MTFKLPEPFFVPGCFGLIKEGAFTADQVRAAYEQGIEDAAQIADAWRMLNDPCCRSIPIARAIRALKEGLYGGGTA